MLPIKKKKDKLYSLNLIVILIRYMDTLYFSLCNWSLILLKIIQNTKKKAIKNCIEDTKISGLLVILIK